MTPNELTLRPAEQADIPPILRLLGEARAYQLRSGHPQWAEGYPAWEDIARDVEGGHGVVLLHHREELVGYAALFTQDRGYAGVSVWDAGRSYCSMHRIALSDACRGQGLGSHFLELLREHILPLGVDELRFDTGTDNQPMQHIGSRLGYECLGEALFPWGVRLAYRLKLW